MQKFFKIIFAPARHQFSRTIIFIIPFSRLPFLLKSCLITFFYDKAGRKEIMYLIMYQVDLRSILYTNVVLKEYL